MTKQLVAIAGGTVFLAMVGLHAGITPPPRFDLVRQYLGAGGVASGGNYEVVHSVGFPATTSATGGDYDFTPGVWPESPPGDCAYDGSVTLIDYASMWDCLTGPVPPAHEGGCVCFDIDANGAIDLVDFGGFQRAFDGG